jgi:hypothetical protein
MVRIVARPIGEAPEWVRDAWIGLQIPLLCSGQRTFRSVGVLSDSDSFLRRLVGWLAGRPAIVSGYVVNARTAVDLLEAHAPQAAAWWRANTSHLLDGSRNFLFDTACCEVDD